MGKSGPTKKYDEQLVVPIQGDIKTALDELANKLETTKAGLTRRAIKELLKRHREKQDDENQGEMF